MYFRKKKNKGSVESKKALEDAHENLRRVRARTPEVKQVSQDLRDIRNRNHFAEQLQVIMGIDMGGGCQ